ncbi:type II secretion system F family protein [Yersinia intermedia]|uniref:Tight adherance operon protein n=1 Tax=Yersinia intermedia TaxID=631 RepID=A0A209A0H8_YERIN|nr:type II secretion system F family protein [Yersinia intermedia]MCB5314855.1 type II secretion system F family protein [Yersinia intermedia]MCB5322758.1 type II secretion system F family protein [Yersinia intermedia]MCB5328815.1 type II secretion system F family protein [Yersinia intermedia]OVZ86266.1 tight adherance operon protein [Yersinia intermedia]UZM71609.1 type II secretion system F family protein [Yersinia intermedia]
MNIIFIAMVLFGFISLLISKKKSNKKETYNKINNDNDSSTKIEKNKSKNQQEIGLSSFIKLPYILHNVTYLKILIISLFLIVMLILVKSSIITTNSMSFLMIGMIMLITTIYLPKVIIRNIVNKKIKNMLNSLPFFIDITAACVQSGMTIDSALSYTAKRFKLINIDLSLIIAKITKRAEINGLESAIKEFQQLSTETEIKMFCSALQYSISFGSTVYEQLIKLSQDMREMQLLVTEEKNSKLSTKLTFPMFLFILIPFVVLVISPSVLELLKYVQTM